MFTIDISPVFAFFLLFGLVYSFALLYLAVLERQRLRNEASSFDHVFSLIIPAHNEETVLEDSLNASLRLDYPKDRHEIVVVDDGSSDRTTTIASRLPDRGTSLFTLVP